MSAKHTYRPRFGKDIAIDGYPPTNTTVKVWYMSCEVPAVWTGTRWQTPEGVPMRGEITHWYSK